MTDSDTQGLPTIRSWSIKRSGAGLRIHGSIDGRTGRLTADEILCVGGVITAVRDGATIARLVTETVAQAVATGRAA